MLALVATASAVASMAATAAAVPVGRVTAISPGITALGYPAESAVGPELLLPTVTAVSPNEGPEAGATSVTITGTGFTAASAVSFGSTEAASFTVDSDSSITAVSPAGTGTVDVTVSTLSGTSATSSADQFSYAPAPTVTAVSPRQGPEAGATSATITGTNFSGATAVRFGSTEATSFTLDSNGSITALSPAGTGTVDVTVSTAGGTSATSAADQFSYVPAPTVTAVSPSQGPEEGATSVTITGTNLGGATAVRFGSTTAKAFKVDTPSSITAVSRAGTGTVDVTVSTLGGTSATSAADEFSYMPRPTVTGVSPAGGPVAGNTTVTVTGTALTGTTRVRFGVLNATSFTVDSDSRITAVSPAKAAGPVAVIVTTPWGTNETGPADQFSYALNPSVTGVSPKQGPAVGGTSVTITGKYLNGATAVKFGSTDAPSFTVNSDSSITAVAPSGTGTVDVTVTAFGGVTAARSADRFSYIPPPTVTGSLKPKEGPVTGGTQVTIVGKNLTRATAVKFGSANAVSFTVKSATSIVAVSAEGRGTVDVTVTTPSGTSATSPADRFSYLPSVTKVDPNTGSVAGGTSVSITGTAFLGVTAVNFGSTPASSFTINTDSSITAVSPAGAAGIVDVTVIAYENTSPRGTTDQFSYVAPPTVAKLKPNNGPATGGTSVTVTGANFSGITAVKFGSADAASFMVNSKTSITAVAPAGTGTVDVTVANAAGASAAGAGDLYTYN